MQAVALLKTIEVENSDVRQTLLILPAAYLKQFPSHYKATFRELTMDSLLLSMVSPQDVSAVKSYRLVTSRGSSWTSVPRSWLQNIGARPGDRLEIWATADPTRLLIFFRRKPTDA